MSNYRSVCALMHTARFVFSPISWLYARTPLLYAQYPSCMRQRTVCMRARPCCMRVRPLDTRVRPALFVCANTLVVCARAPCSYARAHGLLYARVPCSYAPRVLVVCALALFRVRSLRASSRNTSSRGWTTCGGLPTVFEFRVRPPPGCIR